MSNLKFTKIDKDTIHAEYKMNGCDEWFYYDTFTIVKLDKKDILEEIENFDKDKEDEAVIAEFLEKYAESNKPLYRVWTEKSREYSELYNDGQAFYGYYFTKYQAIEDIESLWC